jgi:hypothetical protein
MLRIADWRIRWLMGGDRRVCRYEFINPAATECGSPGVY